jgi:2-dehydropantoate 2-reductase
MPQRSYAILGTGAVGGYYGARLHHGGSEVHFLLHSDYLHVRTNGLRVESKHGDFSIPEPNIYGDPRDLPPCDVAMVCLKTTQNDLLPVLLPHVLKPGGAVVMMQNGLGIEEAAAAVVPGHTIVGGLAFLCSNKIGPGHIHHLDYGDVRVGQHVPDGSAAGVTATVQRIVEDFERAGLPVAPEEDLVAARWKKLVWNITYNGLCVVYDCPTDVVMAAAERRARCEGIMREVIAAAAACKRPVDPAFVPFMLEATEKMASYKPSMLLDHERGQPLEIEAIYGNPLRAARVAGVECPLIAELYGELLDIERRR